GNAMTSEKGYRWRGQEKICTQVSHNAHAHAEDSAVVLHSSFDIDRVAAGMEGEHVFLPLRHPFHRALQYRGKVRYGNVFREHAAFLAKATPDVRCQHTHPTLWTVQELGHIVFDVMWCLGRVPYR